jgi:hypothetical protein
MRGGAKRGSAAEGRSYSIVPTYIIIVRSMQYMDVVRTWMYECDIRYMIYDYIRVYDDVVVDENVCVYTVNIFKYDEACCEYGWRRSFENS